MRRIISSFVFISLLQTKILFGQIAPLPFQENSEPVPQTQLDAAFIKLHNFSESIYRSKKISSINQDGFTESEERWQAGSWGRGYFTWFVDIPATSDPNNIDKYYKRWYNDEMQWGSYPLVKDTSRRVIAYIYKFLSGDRNPIYYQRIVEGIHYLIEQQKANQSKKNYGSYVQWFKRAAKDSANTDNVMKPNYGTEYSTGLAIRALVEAVMFFEKEGWPNKLEKGNIISTIHKSASWLLHFTKEYDSGSIKISPNLVNGPPINYRVFALWGLTSAYRITKDTHYLNRAVDIYKKNISNFQDDDGTWYYNYGVHEKFHDTTPAYMGIILRGLVDLYDILPENDHSTNGIDLKSQLKNQIFKTINHFTLPNQGVEPRSNKRGMRLLKDGSFLPYYRFSETYHEKAAIAMADELIAGLIYTYHCKDLLSIHERKIIYSYINFLLKPMVENSINRINTSSSVYMVCIARYIYNDWNKFTNSHASILEYRKSDIPNNKFNTSINDLSLKQRTDQEEFSLPAINWDGIVTGVFDWEKGEEVVFYKRDSGVIDFYNPNNVELNTVLPGKFNISIMTPVDVDNDGLEELVFYCPESDSDIKIYNTKSNNIVSSMKTKSGSVFNIMLSGDYDKDGKDEFVIYRKDGLMRIFDAENLLSDKSINIEKNMDFACNTDLDKDGFDEIAFFSRTSNTVIVYSIESNKPFVQKNMDSEIQIDQIVYGNFEHKGYTQLALFSKLESKLFLYEYNYSKKILIQTNAISTKQSDIIIPFRLYQD